METKDEREYAGQKSGSDYVFYLGAPNGNVGPILTALSREGRCGDGTLFHMNEGTLEEQVKKAEERGQPIKGYRILIEEL